MSSIPACWRRFATTNEAATLAEYGLIVFLLSIIAIAAIVVIGRYVNGAFTGVADGLESAGATKVP